MWLGTMSDARRMPRCPRPVSQVRPGRLAAQVVCDAVVHQGVRGRDRLGVALELLDALGRVAALPEPDEPQPGESPVAQPVQLGVGDAVEGADGTAVAARQLVQPDVGALGHEHQAGHPVQVPAERLGLLGGAREPAHSSRLGRPGATAHVTRPGAIRGCPVLGEDIEAACQPLQHLGVHEVRPVVPDPAAAGPPASRETGARARGVARRGPARRLSRHPRPSVSGWRPPPAGSRSRRPAHGRRTGHRSA